MPGTRSRTRNRTDLHQLGHHLGHTLGSDADFLGHLLPRQQHLASVIAQVLEAQRPGSTATIGRAGWTAGTSRRRDSETETA